MIDILTSQIEALNAAPARNSAELRARTATIAKLTPAPPPWRCREGRPGRAPE